MSKKKVIENIREDLAISIADTLNKQHKDYKVAYFLDGDSEVPTNVTDWVSTGSSILDLVISNRKNGGLPVGKIVEVTGLEASGKSLLAAHVLSNTQKIGGVSVYIDTESAVSKEFLEAIGVNTSKLVYSQLETVEDIFSSIESIIEKVRSSNKDKVVTIVVDSMAAASTKIELESEYDKDGWATSKAIIISKAMRKITNMIARQKILLVFTNQLRQKLGVMGVGEMYTTSGGKALGFHSSVRLRLSAIGKIKKGDEVIGIKCKSQVIKNRIGPPLRNAVYDMYFSYGIDDNSDMFNYLKEKELLLKQSGAWYTIIDKNEKEIKFQLKDWNELLKNNSELREYIYDVISENIIMKYDNIGNVEIGETNLDSSVDNE